MDSNRTYIFQMVFENLAVEVFLHTSFFPQWTIAIKKDLHIKLKKQIIEKKYEIKTDFKQKVIPEYGSGPHATTGQTSIQVKTLSQR